MHFRQTGYALLLLLGAWQAVILAFSPPRYILPSPLAVAMSYGRQPQFLMHHALITAGEILIGLVVGCGLGALTALCVAAFPKTGRLVWPLVVVLQAFPVFVLAPILVIWLGFGMASKVAMTVIIIFFPVASAFADGLRRTEPVLIDAASLTPASHFQILRHIRLPLALPALVSGLRVAAPLAPLGAIVGEWVGAAGGLGFVMVQANARMQTDMLFAAMVILALFTVLLRLAVDRLTRGLAPWAREATDTSRHPSFPPRKLSA
ncbi:putative hydroxymethylpyrimidine transport system permease protein [Neorhizobium galegae]|uniref:ABC transporter permease n=1 Tax=Rhizobium/Agrobacterium group TaxID=227290 RepID=UPI001AEB5ED1|nr:ABC transporter permease [Neorhizobium galegae]MBP2551163.1 putative hydroxymethylpyrimidine transport system permease protein [Neorhizobium galegae]